MEEFTNVWPSTGCGTRQPNADDIDEEPDTKMGPKVRHRMSGQDERSGR
jgi:hypothetical protein